MSAARMGKLLRVVLVALMLPVWPAVTARAQAPAATDSTSRAAAPAPTTVVLTPAMAAAQARELIRNGDNDRAIEVLRGTIEQNAARPAELAEPYLLLIKTYVFLGNDYKFRPQGREASNLNYQAARDRVEEALSIPELRRLEPVPAEDYPPEMVAFFAEARTRMFGGFRVVGVQPADAVVTLDGATLPAKNGLGERAAPDLTVGEHTVTVRAESYNDVIETITISPGATLERNYTLGKHRGTTWYATRWGAAAAIAVGAAALIARSKDEGPPPPPEPLPGAPPPPAR